jgi:crossover junction endodeoxyribonuclease RuvC
MKIIGIDPGLAITGYSIMEKVGTACKIHDAGIIKNNPTLPIPTRLHAIHKEIKQLIEKHGVQAIALETPFLGKNAQNFLKLGYIRGTIYLLVHEYTLELFEFTPTQVKISVTGFGGASKEQVARVITRFFPQIQMPATFDLTDAVAISLCAAWQNPKTIEFR